MKSLKEMLCASATALSLTFATTSAAIVTSGLTPYAAAQARTAEEQNAIRTIETAWNRYSNSNKSASAAKRHILSQFDMYSLSAAVIGPDWRSMNNGQRRDFMNAFSDHLVKKYADVLKDFAGGHIEYKTHIKRSGRMEVRTDINKGGRSLEIDYMVYKSGPSWKVYNARLHGVLMSAHFKKEFNPIIDRKGIDGLIRDLQSGHASLEQDMHRDIAALPLTAQTPERTYG